ncbi:MAG TPA: HDOD domain-containing protein, partial [Noviherbaspirillum sp.]
KAIFLIGLETVKTTALAMLLVDRLAKVHAQSVRNELMLSLNASIIGREVVRNSHHKCGEEAAIAGLFKNIGRLLLAAHDHNLYVKFMALVESGSHTPVQASMEVLGCSLDQLGESILREWNIPEPIIQALAQLPAGVLKPAKGQQEWMQQVAAFSASAARLVPGMNDPDQENEREAVLTRFGIALNLDALKLHQLLTRAACESRELAGEDVLSQPSEETAEQAVKKASEESALPSELMLELAEDAQPLQVSARHASGKPLNARDLLLAGVLDATQMMASGGCRVNDLMLLVLETLYSGMGFRFATVCLKDGQMNMFRARISVGENYMAREAGFVFRPAGNDLFKLALENDADLMISDASIPKIRNLLPAWHRTLLPDARSFIVLPLVAQNRQLGLFYADRNQPASEGMPADETALIKTLKGQVLTALSVR